MGYETDFYAQHPEAFLRFRDLVDRVPRLVEYFDSRGLLEGVESLLSIGAGDGALELSLAAEHGLRLGVIEPDDSYRRAFLAALAQGRLESRLVVCRGERFEDLPPGAIVERFDLVLSVHSWYAFGLDEGALSHALSLRSPRGRLVIILASSEGPTGALKALGPRATGDLSAETLSAWAVERGYDHHLELIPRPLPAATLLSGEELNDGGRAFVSFLVAMPFEELATGAQEEARRILVSYRRGDVLALASAGLLFREPS